MASNSRVPPPPSAVTALARGGGRRGCRFPRSVEVARQLPDVST